MEIHLPHWCAKQFENDQLIPAMTLDGLTKAKLYIMKEATKDCDKKAEEKVSGELLVQAWQNVCNPDYEYYAIC